MNTIAFLPAPHFARANPGGEKMTLTWAQRREKLLADCIVSPDVFTPMIDRLAAFVVPYQQALETEVAQRNMHLSLQGLLSHLPSKNAEDIATSLNLSLSLIGSRALAVYGDVDGSSAANN